MRTTRISLHCVCFLAATIALLAGCTANQKAVFRHKVLTDHDSITTVDAKQRAILRNAAHSVVGGTNDVTRVCSEPSPDVFSIVAQALSASGSFGKSANPATMEAALSAAFSSTEQGSTIPRTQTINMLRELMFRTCERYLNGAYNELEISIQAIRDQRLIVSILAIEQITGVVAPAPVIIGAAGTSSAGGGNAAIVRLDDALKAKEAAETAYRNAETHFNELNGEQNICDAIADAVKKGEDLTDPQKANQAKCDQARTSMVSARELVTTSTDHHANLRRLAAMGGVTASTQVTTSPASGDADGGRNDAIEKIAEIVNTIVSRSFSDDTEVMLFCLKALTDRDLSTPETKNRYESLLTSCLGYLNERVRVEEQKLQEEAQQSAARMQVTDTGLFEHYWPRLEQRLNAQGKEAFIVGLKTALLSSESGKADCFRNAEAKAQYMECFIALPAQLKRNLPGVE